MPAMILPYLAKYWWVAVIAALLVAVKIQTARYQSAVKALNVSNAQIEMLGQQNHDMKAGVDKCNAAVDQLRADGQAWQQRAEAAETKANQIMQQAQQTAAAVLAHPPANDCKSILAYGRAQAEQFKW